MKTIIIEVWQNHHFKKYCVVENTWEDEQCIWNHCFNTLGDFEKDGVWVRNKTAWKTMCNLLKIHGYEPKLIDQ